VLRNNTLVDLTTVEFDLLHTLLSAAGRVVTREDISQRVLGRAFDPFDQVAVELARRKAGPDAEKHLSRIEAEGTRMNEMIGQRLRRW
jgi:DNA-binding response OmpR family regulator